MINDDSWSPATPTENKNAVISQLTLRNLAHIPPLRSNSSLVITLPLPSFFSTSQPHLGSLPLVLTLPLLCVTSHNHPPHATTTTTLHHHACRRAALRPEMAAGGGGGGGGGGSSSSRAAEAGQSVRGVTLRDAVDRASGGRFIKRPSPHTPSVGSIEQDGVPQVTEAPCSGRSRLRQEESLVGP